MKVFTPSRNNAQSGNILFFLLVAIALFAALGFTVSNMIRSERPQSFDQERAGLLAGEILALGNNYRQAVQDLRISNGCEDEDISFEHADLSGYTHSPVADDDCKVFGFSGGAGLSYVAPPAEWLDSTQSAKTRYGEIVFSGEVCVAGLPDGAWNGCDSDSIDNEELLMIVPFVKKDICLRINDDLGITNPGDDAPVDDGCSWSNVFDGTYSDAESLGAASGELESKLQGCYRHDSNCGTHDGTYHVYQTLIRR